MSKNKALETKQMHDWFLTLWDEREDKEGNCYCYETGKRLRRETYRENTCCYSHLLPKNKYPEYKLEPWNVVIVHPNAHTQFEVFPIKAPRQLQLKNKLINEYL